MSRNNKSGKRFFKLSIILYVVIISLVGVYSLAWFVANKRVEMGVQEDVRLSVGSNLDFAVIEDPTAPIEWRSKILLSQKREKNYPDVTGGLVGEDLKFYYPTVLDDHDNVLQDTELLKELKDQDGYYIQFRLRFRASVDMSVYLSDESYVSPKDLSKADSAYGTISTDFIAGAARVSFSEVIETDQNGAVVKEQLKNIWIPNDKYHLYYDKVDTVIDGITVQTTKAFASASGERELFYRNVVDQLDPNYQSDLPYGYLSIENDMVKHNAWTEEDYCNRLISVGTENLASKGVNNISAINSAKELVTFNSSEGDLLEKDIVVRIWFEGTDREADKALNGGRVNYNLVFLGIDKTGATTEMQTKLSSLVYKEDGKIYLGDGQTLIPATSEDNILFSTNGIDWMLYNPTGNNVPLADNLKNYAYAKIRETAGTKGTEVIKLNKTN